MIGADELVQLRLEGRTISILSVLDQEHHQEGHDRCARVDDQLPRIGIVEEGASQRPCRNGQAAESKSRWPAGRVRGVGGKPAKPDRNRSVMDFGGCLTGSLVPSGNRFDSTVGRRDR